MSAQAVFVLLPPSADDVARRASEAVHAEIESRAEVLPDWGKVWARDGRVIGAMQVHPIKDFGPPPVMLIDESMDERTKTFLIGGLLLRPLHAVLLVLAHLQNLLLLASRHAGFWNYEAAPPRMHLREWTKYEARMKTAWRHIPIEEIKSLVKLVVPGVRELAGLRLLSPVSIQDLRRSLKRAFSDTDVEIQLRQVSIQMASLQIGMMLQDSKPAITEIELIADRDSTPVSLGPRRRQATLHLLDGLVGETKLPVKLTAGSQPYTSRFPADFSLRTLANEGYPIRPLMECIGLQVCDVYLGLWRATKSGKECLGIRNEELDWHLIPSMTWA